MKKQNLFKTLQLIIYIIFTVLFLVKIITDPSVGQLVAANNTVRILCIILWALLGLSFLFIFFDFNMISNYKKDYSSLSQAVHTDSLSGLANRYGCDAIIEKYLDKPLPPEIGCIMFDLTNIFEINQEFGYLEGNNLIRDFSMLLKLTSAGLCFVGRNGGNKFMAIFETCSEEKMSTFLSRLERKVNEHNQEEGKHPITYKYGKAFQETADIKTINQLIALSNRRIYETQDV